MKRVKAFEKDITRFYLKKCNYILIPSDNIKEGEDIILDTEMGEYFAHVTDVEIAARFSTCQISILTVDRFEVIK